MSGDSSLMTFKEAAQALHTTVAALYQLKWKDKRPFPKPGYVDVEWFARNKIAYENAMNDAKRFWLELQTKGWSMNAVGRELYKHYHLPSTTTVDMLRKGLWMRVKRKQYYWTLPRSVRIFLQWKEEYYGR